MNQSPLQKALQKLREKSIPIEIYNNESYVPLIDAWNILEEMEIDILKEIEEHKNNKIKHY